jgi:hypothetical protein
LIPFLFLYDNFIVLTDLSFHFARSVLTENGLCQSTYGTVSDNSAVAQPVAAIIRFNARQTKGHLFVKAREG